MHALDDVIGYQSIRDGVWKYVNSSTYEGKYDSHLGEIGSEVSSENYFEAVLTSEVAKSLSSYGKVKRINLENIIKILKINCQGKGIECKPWKSPCLFNI